jgi:hypothetical protein
MRTTTSIATGALVYFASLNYTAYSQETQAYEEYGRALLKFDQLPPDEKPQFVLNLINSVKTLPESKTPLQKFEILLRVLQLLDIVTIKNFDFSDTPAMHIAPPMESGVDSGVASSEIKDPVLRKEHEIKVAKNKVKAKLHGEQHSLLLTRRSVLSRIRVFLRNHRDSFSILKAAIDSSALENKSKIELLGLLSKEVEGRPER